ncbi:BHLH domain-containing protein [Mycena indigotica]|uniref:BHLH domain-containing protein n=1 Tax=Mycena indigotica TaxID=2126181 RepID=A0A8H6SWZ2_9AGAR|nr:BHLH domain-containing protein [Mycena indigotica]KAF7307498.1 BHLH domain-containing protein [Mycena indigotica]
MTSHFADFENFSFDPSLFRNPPPPLPSSADLFSPSETSDLFGFLDTFGWEDQPPQFSSPRAPYSNPHLHTVPEPSTSTKQRRATTTSTSRPRSVSSRPDYNAILRANSQTPSNASESSTNGTPPPQPPQPQIPSVSLARSNSTGSIPANISANKPLLSTPQKRLNHIMSEQKRRNAIRDGYAQLISILAPAGAQGIGMPQRGRPKGSGSRGKGQSKGKSGVLFRAVEYIKWLEEGSEAMRMEVTRVETAAGIVTR